jgi:hypothetical protein
MSDVDVHALAVAAPTLRELVLRIVPHGNKIKLDAGLSFLAMKCRKLERLGTTNCDITDVTVAHFADSCNALRRVSFESEPFLTDNGLHILTTSLTQLHHLHLYSCIQVTGAGLRSAHTLKDLLLGQLPWLTGSALVYWARLQDLEYLSVTGWPPLSDAIVEKLLKSSSKSLDMIMFGGAPHLTRRVLECHAKLGSRQNLWFRGKSFPLH